MKNCRTNDESSQPRLWTVTNQGNGLVMSLPNFLGVGPPSCLLWVGKHGGDCPSSFGRQTGEKKKSNGAPKSTLTPLLIGNRAMRSPLGMFVFNFDQKVDVTPPPTPLFRGQNQFFLGDVFIFCLDCFDTLNGTSWWIPLPALFFWASVLKNWLN